MVKKLLIHNLTSRKSKTETIKTEILKMLDFENKPIILFGGGAVGKYNLKILRQLNRNIKFFFCDNDSRKCGSEIDGAPVICFSELIKKVPDCYILISSTDFFSEIAQQLQENGLLDYLLIPSHHFSGEYSGKFEHSLINDKTIVQKNFARFEEAYELFSDEFSKEVFIERVNYLISGDPKYLIQLKSNGTQYFDPEVINLSENEAFVDGGAFDGDTIIGLLKHTNGNFSKIFAFEPEKSKLDRIPEKISADSRINFYNLGLWDKEAILRFQATNDGLSRISNNGNIEVPVTSIDETVKGQPVTFIKMDIEGSELKALEGAQETIIKNKPKLAICVYHNVLDLAGIPLYIKKLVPEYKFYLRHYGESQDETVCYAIVD